MTDRLDLLFHALADPTRRAIIARLMSGPASVTELAQPLDIGLPTLLAHLDRLERAGLVRSTKRGRVRSYRANPVALAPARRWIGGRGADWSARAAGLPARVVAQVIEAGGGAPLPDPSRGPSPTAAPEARPADGAGVQPAGGGAPMPAPPALWRSDPPLRRAAGGAS